VTVENVPVPILQATTDVRVRITTAAICGKDLHVIHGGFGSSNPSWVLGHEGTGIVESVGSGVNKLKVGDHVVIPDSFDTGGINVNLAMEQGRYGQGVGLGEQFGSYYGCQDEYVVVLYADYSLWTIPSNGAVNASKEVDYLLILDMFATGWTALTYAGFQAGDTVAVFGAGEVGLFCAYSAILRGASRVYVVDWIPQRLALAESIGAIPISLNGSDLSAVEQILRLEPQGPTRSVDCVGYEAMNGDLEWLSIYSPSALP
ncbi:alcohol dehydrogenase protein, partial [Paraphaeosphaeria sporulosa]